MEKSLAHYRLVCLGSGIDFRTTDMLGVPPTLSPSQGVPAFQVSRSFSVGHPVSQATSLVPSPLPVAGPCLGEVTASALGGGLCFCKSLEAPT